MFDHPIPMTSTCSRRGLAPRGRRRGAAAVLAMLYLVLLSGLATAMFHVATLNGRGAAIVADTLRARSLAESGLRWQSARLADPALRPRIESGRLTATDADNVWLGFTDSDGKTIVGMRDRIAADWSAITSNGAKLAVTQGADYVEMSGLNLEGGVVSVRVDRLPADAYVTDAGDPSYRHFIEVIATATTDAGTSREVSRTSRMRFSLDKRIDFAVVGKTRIQLGRNTLVDGPVAMGTANKFSPYLILSDFGHFDSWLDGQLETWQNLLVDEQADWGNRIRDNGSELASKAADAGFTDYDGDGWIDEFDLLLRRFDGDGDLAISELEFTGPSGLYEPDLWNAVDAAGGPMFAGDTPRVGWNDGQLDKNDLYAKVRGTISMKDSADSWQNWLDDQGRGETIRDLLKGPLVAENPDEPVVTFGASTDDMIDLNPLNFEGATEHFAALSGENAGSPIRGGGPVVDDSGREMWISTKGKSKGAVFWADAGTYDAYGTSYNGYEVVLETNRIENATLSRADAETFVDGSGILQTVTRVERTPFGSTSYQATYERPVFKDMTFKNVTIPRGLNAVFENCTFEGVTFVDVERNVTVGGTVRTDSGSGSTWSKRMKSGGFSNNTVLTSANSYGFDEGNNLRFDSCTFEGPLTNGFQTAYTHFGNSWEFTGNTKFDNQADETATIVAPQTNIEMGSFERPGEAPSTMKGVVVAGNIDIRGVGVVDGSIIVTGDGAGNTTLGYFGASDGDTNPDALPESGGYGRLNIRYNPYRALPDGINIHVTVDAVSNSYRED